MPLLRCEVLRRDTDSAVVAVEDGTVLRLYFGRGPGDAWWFGTVNGAGVWAEPAMCADPPCGEVLYVDTAVTDEVGVEVGPDRDHGGLFDVSHSSGNLTGERTGHSDAAPDAHPEQRRTAVLAWIAAAPDASLAEDGPASPCEPLKRLIADEPLDPLPALDGGPLPPAPPASSLAPREPEPEITATQIQGFDLPEVSEPVAPPPAPLAPSAPARWPFTLIVVALLVLVAVMYARAV